MRERKFDIVSGAPGSGKSTFLSKLVNAYPQNVIVYKHLANIDDKAFSALTAKTTSNFKQGAAPGAFVKCKIAGTQEDYPAFLQWIKRSYRNGLLIIDDCTIFERDRLSKTMNELVTMRRHYGIDIILVYHGLSLLPIEQFIFINNLVLFKTSDNFIYKANKIPNIENIKRYVLQANKNARTKELQYTPVIYKIN